MTRRATKDDLPVVMQLLVRFHAENGIVPIAPEKLTRKIGILVSAGNLIVAERASKIVALLAIMESEFWYGRDRYLTDQLFYVAPKFRASDVGKELMDEMKAEAARRGNLPCVIAVMNPVRAKKRGRIASLHGWFPMGYYSRIA